MKRGASRRWQQVACHRLATAIQHVATGVRRNSPCRRKMAAQCARSRLISGYVIARRGVNVREGAQRHTHETRHYDASPSIHRSGERRNPDLARDHWKRTRATGADPSVSAWCRGARRELDPGVRRDDGRARHLRFVIPANAGIQLLLSMTGTGSVQPAQTHQFLRGVVAHARNWIPAFAGMPVEDGRLVAMGRGVRRDDGRARHLRFVIPANAGIQRLLAMTGTGPVQPAQTHQFLRGVVAHARNWIPAFAGMTVGEGRLVAMGRGVCRDDGRGRAPRGDGARRSPG
jgi:hypothetical protein